MKLLSETVVMTRGTPFKKGGPVRPEGGGPLGDADVLVTSETCEWDRRQLGVGRKRGKSGNHLYMQCFSSAKILGIGLLFISSRGLFQVGAAWRVRGEVEGESVQTRVNITV